MQANHSLSAQQISSHARWVQLSIALAVIVVIALITTLQDVLGFDLAIPEPLRTYERVLVAHPSVAAESAAYHDALASWVTAKLRG
ncbi:MAG: hypothetical protein ACPHER_03990 [Nevskiales bacterium]